jgi:hypothetical protein
MHTHTLRRALVVGLALVVLLLALYHRAAAEAPTRSHPAHVQIWQMLPALRDSDAEHASGAYLPGVGAVITLDLLRGPNTMPDQPAHRGVHDWAIYLMQTFGAQLDAVPPDERISVSVDFFDYDTRTYHQLVVMCRAADAADPARYTLWLNGQPYAAEVGE